MKRLLLLVVLALMLAACDDEYQVSGEYTDGHGVQRVSGVDTRDGALVSIPKVQVTGNPQAGDCIRGTAIYGKAECR